MILSIHFKGCLFFDLITPPIVSMALKKYPFLSDWMKNLGKHAEASTRTVGMYKRIDIVFYSLIYRGLCVKRD
jgi:hypothetical protein